jgi:hypothetical protein
MMLTPKLLNVAPPSKQNGILAFSHMARNTPKSMQSSPGVSLESLQVVGRGLCLCTKLLMLHRLLASYPKSF